MGKPIPYTVRRSVVKRQFSASAGIFDIGLL